MKFGVKILSFALAMTLSWLSPAALSAKEPADTFGISGTIAADYATTVFDVNTVTPAFTFTAGNQHFAIYGATKLYHIEDNVDKSEIIGNKVSRIDITRRGITHKINRRADYLIGAFYTPKPLHRLAVQFNGYRYYPRNIKEQIQTTLKLPEFGVFNGVARYKTKDDHSDFYDAAAAYSVAFDSIGGRTLSFRADLNHLSGQRGVEMLSGYVGLLKIVEFEDEDKSRCNDVTIGTDFSAPRLGPFTDFHSGITGFLTERKSTYVIDKDLATSRQKENILQADLAASLPFGKFTANAHLAAQFFNKYDNIEGDIVEPKFQFLPAFSLSYATGKLSLMASAKRTLIRPSLANTDGIVRRANEVMFTNSLVRLHSDRHDDFALTATYGPHTFLTSYTINHSPIVTDYVVVSKDDFAEVQVNFRRSTDTRFQYTFDGDITRWWHLTASATANWQRNPGAWFKRIHWAWTGNLTSHFSIGRLGALDVVADYASDYIAGNILFGSSFNLNIDWSKSLLSDRLMLRVGVHDVFNTDDDSFEMSSKELSYIVSSKSVTRRLWLGVTYNFSSGGKAAPSRLTDITPIPNFDTSRL